MITRPWGDKVPNVLVDPWTLLGKDARIIPLFNPIISSAQVTTVSGGVPSVAENIFAALMILAEEGSEPVKIVINSPGGSLQAGFTILQAIEHLKASGIEVWTVNMCNAMSMAGIVLAMGTKGRRYALNNTTTHVHEVQVSGLGGRGTDVQEAHEHLQYQREVVEKLLAENTNIPEYDLSIEYSDSPEILAASKIQLSDPKFRQKRVREFAKNERLLSVDKAKEAGMIDVVLMPGDEIIKEIFRRSLRPKKEKQP